MFQYKNYQEFWGPHMSHDRIEFQFALWGSVCELMCSHHLECEFPMASIITMTLTQIRSAEGKRQQIGKAHQLCTTLALPCFVVFD